MRTATKRRGCLITIVVLVAIIGILVLAVRLTYSEQRMGPTPICMVFFPFWDSLPHQTDNTIDMDNAYPNVMGSGAISLQQIATNSGYFDERLIRDYVYVPGLRGRDPDDLVMLYMKKPTRYYWHGRSRPFLDPMWLVFSPGFNYCPTNAESCSERGQRMDTQEFERRLRLTLAFLKNNERPYWTNVVAEQEAFLKTIRTNVQPK
jgi:hypothetical protein